jgi:hypothetical protein
MVDVETEQFPEQLVEVLGAVAGVYFERPGSAP